MSRAPLLLEDLNLAALQLDIILKLFAGHVRKRVLTAIATATATAASIATAIATAAFRTTESILRLVPHVLQRICTFRNGSCGLFLKLFQ